MAVLGRLGPISRPGCEVKILHLNKHIIVMSKINGNQLPIKKKYNPIYFNFLFVFELHDFF